MLAIATGPGDTRKALGERLRVRRLSRDWTQSALAARSGVPLSSLKRFERSGHIGVDAFVRIVYALGLEQDLESLFAAEPPARLEDVLAAPVRRRGRSA